MQYIIGIIIGIAVYAYWPEQVQSVAKDAQVMVHKGAASVAEKTAPTLTHRIQEVLK